MALGLILAGGRSLRFGAEKAASEIDGVSLLERAVDRLSTCDAVAVSCPPGCAAARLAEKLGLACLEDPPASPRGPLAGVLAGLIWAQGQDDTLVTLPCDAPLLPAGLAERLIGASAGAPAAMARTPGGLQPLCAVWRGAMIRPLRAALANGLHPPVHQMLSDAGAAIVDFPDDEAFLNINSPDDLTRAALRLRGGPA